MGKVIFSTNLLMFWAKGEVEVDSRFIKTNVPNLLFDVIPVGNDKQNIPLKNVSGSTLSSNLEGKVLLVGIGVILFSFLTFGEASNVGGFFFSLFTMLLFMAIGASIIVSGIQTTLTIEKSGKPYIIEVPFYERKKLILLDQMIHDALSQDTDKTDLNLFMDQKKSS